MSTVDHRALAGDILRGVGGEQNVASLTHCATRLRFTLRDEGQADKAAVEQLPGVITVVRKGGQFQVVIGQTVPKVYAELGAISGVTSGESGAGEQPKGNLLSRFIELISSIFLPILWPLVGAGVFKAFLSLASSLGLVAEGSTEHTLLNAASDGMFYLLPLLLAVTAAKRFRTNQFTSMAIAAALVYPGVVALAEAGEPVTFLGLPVFLANYTFSVIPIVISVWLQGYLERFLDRVLPGVLRNFTTPLLVLLIMPLLIFLTVGPLTTLAAGALSSGIQWLFQAAPVLAGLVMGGLWQVFVIFGLHWAFVPFMINDYSTIGFSLMAGPLLPAVLAQAGAALAVAIKTRDRALRQAAVPAAVSGFLAGVTEPAIYGINLRLKRPFYAGIAGGAVGGALAGFGGAASNTFVFPSIIGLPAFLEYGNVALLLIGTGIAVVIAMAGTFLFGFQDPAASPQEPSAGGAADAPAEGAADESGAVLAPIAGRAIPLAEVADKAFASGSMGQGIGIVPADGRIVAPVAGTVVAAMPSGHAFGLRSDDGIEVLVHIGIDTVQLDGAHFEPAVTRGQRVAAGDPLGTVDLAGLREAGYDATTMLIITNSADYARVAGTAGAELAAGQAALTITRHGSLSAQ